MATREQIADEEGAIKPPKFIWKNLVALCITYRLVKDGMTVGQEKIETFPGIVICIRGVYSFLTSGHALKDLDSCLHRKEILVTSAVLADTFGPDADCEKPIPFDLLNEKRFFIHDKKEGLDFGLIMLRSYYVRLLEKQGINALFEENWVKQHCVHFDKYAMLGLPDESVSFETDSNAGGSQAIGLLSPTLIRVKRLDSLPEGVEATKHPRFVGQLPQNLPLSSIKGMSGGPIFGFQKGPPEAYWVVAIQSSELRSRGIVFACPLPVIWGLLTAWIDEQVKSLA